MKESSMSSSNLAIVRDGVYKVLMSVYSLSREEAERLYFQAKNTLSFDAASSTLVHVCVALVRHRRDRSISARLIAQLHKAKDDRDVENLLALMEPL